MKRLLLTTLLATSAAPAAAQVSLPAAVAVDEGKIAAVVASRPAGVPKGKTLSFTYRTVAETALAGQDFVARSGSQSIRKNANSYTLNVQTVDDATFEQDERLYLEVTAAGVVKMVPIVIRDNDPAPPPPPVQCPGGVVLPAGSTCPNLPPPPVGSVDIPSPSLQGLEVVASHDFALDLQPAWGSGAIPPDNGIDTVGAYRQVCAQGHLSNDDHVLYPRQPGRAHLHDFSGNKSTNANSTSETLVGHASTCNETLAAHSSQSAAYWITAVITADGKVLRPDHNTVYYKSLPTTNELCGYPSAVTPAKVGICIPFPNGLKMISGSLLVPGQPDKKGPLNIRPTAHAYISCSGTGSTSGAFMNFDEARAKSPICPSVHFNVAFPNCWDGKNLWKTDRSHVVYAYDPHTHGKKICPASNPYNITGVTIHYKYTPTPAQWLAGLSFSSDTVDPTLPKGWSGHADADLTWNTPVKEIAMANCVEKHLNCAGGDLGNGQQLKGASQPYYINPVTGKYEPRWENPMDTIAVPEGLTIAGSGTHH